MITPAQMSRKISGFLYIFKKKKIDHLLFLSIKGCEKICSYMRITFLTTLIGWNSKIWRIFFWRLRHIPSEWLLLQVVIILHRLLSDSIWQWAEAGPIIPSLLKTEFHLRVAQKTYFQHIFSFDPKFGMYTWLTFNNHIITSWN